MFIHTFELSMFINYNEYMALRKELPNARMCGGKKEKYLVYDASFGNEGIAIAMRKTSEKERKYTDAKEDILIVYVNVSKLHMPGDERNHINDESQFEAAMVKLDEKIKDIFSKTCMKGIGVNSFWVSRADITMDITMPREQIPLFLTCIRRLDLQYGFSFNEELERHTQGFDRMRSVNIISKSRGYEFVFYDKEKALMGKEYDSVELEECFRDILRVEIRCKRKFISKIAEGSVVEMMLLLYKNRKRIFYKEYQSIFLSSTAEDFVSVVGAYRETYLQDRTKKKKSAQVDALVKFLIKNENYTPAEACMCLFKKVSTEKTVLRHFQQLGFSPITIPKNEVGVVRILAPDKVVKLGKEMD